MSPDEAARWGNKFYEAHLSGDRNLIANLQDEFGALAPNERWSSFHDVVRRSGSRPVDPSSVEGAKGESGGSSGQPGHSSGAVSDGGSSSGPAAGGGASGKPSAAGEAGPVKGGPPTAVMDKPTTSDAGNGKAQRIIDEAFKTDGPADTSHGAGEGLTSSGPATKTSTSVGAKASTGVDMSAIDRSPAEVGAAAEKRALDAGLPVDEAAEWGRSFAQAHESGGHAAVTELHGDLNKRIDQFLGQRVDEMTPRRDVRPGGGAEPVTGGQEEKSGVGEEVNPGSTADRERPDGADLVATHLGGDVLTPRSGGGWTTHRPGALPPATVATPAADTPGTVQNDSQAGSYSGPSPESHQAVGRPEDGPTPADGTPSLSPVSPLSPRTSRTPLSRLSPVTPMSPAGPAGPASRSASGGDRIVVAGHIESSDYEDHIVVDGESAPMTPDEFVAWLQERPEYEPGVPVVLLAGDASVFAFAVAPLLDAPVTGPWGDFSPIPTGDLAAGTLLRDPDDELRIGDAPHDGWYTFGPDGDLVSRVRTLPDSGAFLRDQATAERVTGRPVGIWRSTTAPQKAAESPAPTPGGEETSHGAALAGDHPSEPGPEGGHAETVSLPSADQPEAGTPVDRARATLGLLPPAQREGLLNLTDTIIREAITRPRTGQPRPRAPREWRFLVAAEIARSGEQAGENLAHSLVADNPPTRNSAAEPSTEKQAASRVGGARLPKGPVVEGEYHPESFTVRIPGSDQDLDPEQTARWIEGNTTYGPGRPVILNIPGVAMPGPEGGSSFADLVATHLGGTVVVPRSSGLSIGNGWTTHRPGELPGTRRLDPDHAWNRLLDPAISPERRQEALSQAVKLIEERIQQVRPGENPRGAVSRPDDVVVLVAAEYLRGPRSAGALTNRLIPGKLGPLPTVAGPAPHVEADGVAAPLTDTAPEPQSKPVADVPASVAGPGEAPAPATATPLQPGTTRPGTVGDVIEVVDAASDQVEAVPDEGLSRDPDLVREVNKVLTKTPQWTRGDVSEAEVAYWHGRLPRHWRLPGAYQVKDRAEATAALMVGQPLPRGRGGGNVRDSRAGSFQRTGPSSRAAVPALPRHEAVAGPGDDYYVLLIGVFGTRLLRDESSYMALHQAVRRLDDLRRSDPLIGGGAFDLDAVVRRVQVLDADVAVTEWQRRQVVRLAAGVGGQVDSLAEVAAHYLVEQGVLSGHRLRLPDGDAYGVNWLPYRAHPDLDVLTVDAVVRDGDGRRRRRPATAAPWSPDGALPYAVLAEGGPEHLVMPVGEERRSVPADVVAEVLALDPLLAAEDGGLPLEVPGLLAVSRAGRSGLEFPRRIAYRTGRNFWSTSGELDLRSNVLTMVVRPGRPQGSWLLSRPDEVGPADRDAPDWTRHVVSHTVQVGGRLIRAAYRDAEYAETREDNFREIDRLDTYVHADPVNNATLRVAGPPVDWSYAYFAHGIPGRIHLPLKDGTVRAVTYRVFARHGLSRRPSVRNLRKVTARDDGQYILLAPCWAAAPTAEPRPLGRHPGASAPFVFDPLRTPSGIHEAANATGNMVVGPARPSGMGRLGGKLAYAQIADLAGNLGAWEVARPDPKGEDLDALARAAGLADAWAPVPDDVRERTLVLVRALRWQFGPHVDRDPRFGELVSGIGGLERMREADPVLSPFGGFTVHLLDWAARAYGDLPGVAYSDADDLVRQMLSWSGAVAATRPGARLTEALGGRLARLRNVAQDLLSREASTVEATGRRLLRLDASEPFGEAEWSRLFWSMAEAGQWLSELSDPDALAAQVLHLKRPEPGRRAELADLVVSAMAAGRDPDNTVQLGAFHLEMLGAFASDRELLDESGEPWGRNWSSDPTSGVKVQTSELMILQEAGSGRRGTTRREPAPWSGSGGDSALLLYTGRIGGTQVALTIGGTRRQVPYAEFAELVSRDPLLLTRELARRDVVTMSSGVAADRPRLERLSGWLLETTGRSQWVFPNASGLVKPPHERDHWIGVFAAPGEDTRRLMDQWVFIRPLRVDPASSAAVAGMVVDASAEAGTLNSPLDEAGTGHDATKTPPEEEYAGRLAVLLAAGPVDHAEVLRQLRFRASLADGRTAETLDAAFHAQTGRSLAEAVNDAVAGQRAPAALAVDVRRYLGLERGATTEAPPPGPISVALGEPATASPNGKAPAPATATRPAVEVPGIVIVPPDDEGEHGEHGTPAGRITGTAVGGTQPDPRDELAESYPSAIVPTPPRLPLRFSDVVAADEVWKYVIEARHHAAALAELPSDPGGYYDNDKSPGYRAAMLRTFNEVFDREDPLHLDWNTYDHLHDQVVRGVNGDFQRNGVGASMGRFPLRAAEPAPDILEEVIGGRRLISSYDQARTRIDAGEDAGTLTVYQRHVLGPSYVYTLYDSAETPALVDEVFDRFRAEVSSATTDLDRLIAISRTIRALHVLHPYADGNLRLNLHVLLPHLLLSHGFHPLISDDLHAIFNGGYSLHQIAAVLLRGQPSADTEGPVARQVVNRPDEGPRHPAPPAAGGPGSVELDDDVEWWKSSRSEGDCVEVAVWR
ncbi:lonely Cys domain-containing protein [Actinoallomurus sp. NPDC052308]|uniref:lonely Cys domain-containing protein n=1 Tax=Actinoallomurus sp. NPDC052308 TaxID=3155530 RepID=UPI003429FFF9